MRTFEPSDLLPPRTNGGDPTIARAFVAGRRILVTGAGGSIGSELCRHLARLGCGSLLMFERHESSLHEVLLSIEGAPAVAFLGDMLDDARLEEAFATQRPEIVFHAAAHKHLPLAEQHVGEVVKNNVTGTRLVAAAAARHGAARFVLVSTDKAVNPSSVMGATKRVAELMMRDVARTSRTEFIIVRFGNVLGSSSSVLPRFLDQLRNGRPLTVTHPDVRRFFLLVPEAVRLLLDAAALGGSGMTYLFEMGEPIRILDLAHRVIDACGAPASTPIEIIGLRPGEKLDEELLAGNERCEPTGVPHVLAIRSDLSLPRTFTANVSLLETLASTGSRDALIDQLRVIVPEFAPSATAQASA